MQRFRILLALIAVLPLLGAGVCPSATSPPDHVIDLPGLSSPVRVVTDRFGVRHIFADSDLDLVYVQGYVHARDRFWQMDLTRRQVDGTLSEVLGADELDSDVQFRVIGLHRGAARSLAALAPEEREILDSYAAGVNAYLDEAESAGALPAEYAELHLTQVRRWTALDTLVIGKGIAASLSLDIDAGRVETLDAYVSAGDAQGFDGAALLFEDVSRFAPLDPASTIPDATGSTPFQTASRLEIDRRFLADAAAAALRYRQKIEKVPFLAAALERREALKGSNHWGVTAEWSTSGHPMIANDPHLSLDWPSTFYENHLVVGDDPLSGPLNVSGITFPGVPFVILGQNEHIAWGATVNPMDVTDIFRDHLVRNVPGCPPNQVCIESEGGLHPVPIGPAQTYFFNDFEAGIPNNLVNAGFQLDDPGVIIPPGPCRSHGSIVDIDDISIFLGGATETDALVLQFTGFHATREVQTFRIYNRAHNVEEFLVGVQAFDFGSQNWAYADSQGNLGYFTSSELPLRRDLEQGEVHGLPPYFVRDGSGPANWISIPEDQQPPDQAIPFEILPYEEMPQTVNPANGFFANANNDPAGVSLDNDPLNQRRVSKPEAIYYLNPSYAIGARAGRITQLVRDKIQAGEKISLDDMRRFQGNTQQRDAELMLPFLISAYENAQRPGAPAELSDLLDDARVVEAAERLAVWDFSTPTGIPEGYDQHDHDGDRALPVFDSEANKSVAATIYNMWRAKLLRALINARLAALGVPGVGSSDALKATHHLLLEDPFDGVGHSGVDFFPEPAILTDPADRRDAVLLEALREALDALASDTFAPAFHNSTNLDDYRWGKLHRKVFEHEFEDLLGVRGFSVPPAGGFDDLAPDLRGVPRDGGYQVVNASGFSATADGLNSFMFGGGPVRRYAGAAGAGVSPNARVVGYNVIAGGSSGDADAPTGVSQLGAWLTADQHPVEMTEGQALRGAMRVENFEPANDI